MWDPFTKYVRTETTRIFIFAAIWLPSLKPNLFNSSTLRAFGKVCGKLISRKLVLWDATKLKARLQCQSQLARGSRVNLKIYENAISNHTKKNNNWLIISKTIIIYYLQCMVIDELLFNNDSMYLHDIKHNILKAVVSLLIRN